MVNQKIIPDFIDALIREIKIYRDHAQEDKVHTIYFGGGTPTILPPAEIEKIMNALRNNFTIVSDAEITIEANPGTVNLYSLNNYLKMGINRLSIGVQSFIDEELKFLSRIHSSEEGMRAFFDAREAGFKNISIDMIYGLPNQDSTSLHFTLKKCVELKPEHISAYNLTIETGTPLGKMVNLKTVRPMLDRVESLLYLTTMEFLQEAGYHHYEVSNYALPGYHSRHNMNYWRHINYLGMGPSAHSFWINKRWWNVNDIDEYIKLLLNGEKPVSDSEELSLKQILDETILLNLRTGFLDFNKIKNLNGQDIIDKGLTYFKEFEQQNLVKITNEGLFLTNKGFLYCDEIAKRISFLNE